MRPPPSDPNQRTAARGYGARHQRLRKIALAELQAEGKGVCARRCGEPIYPWQELELDHDDNDRDRYIGLTHATCNRSAGGRKGRRAQLGHTGPGFYANGQWNGTSRRW